MRRLFTRELRLLRADNLLAILAAIFCLLSAYGAWNGYGLRQQQQRTIAEVRSEESGRLDSVNARLQRAENDDTPQAQAARSPAMAGRSTATRSLTLDPMPLSALAVGQSDLYPYFVRVNSASRQSAVTSEEIDNPVALLAGRLDLAFVVLVLYPLFVLALTYNVLSNEREQGTLALIASQPADARRIILAKLCVRAAAVVTFAVGVSILASLTAGRDILSAEGVAHLLLWLTIVVAYGAFWFSVALAVNAFGKSSAANAVMVLGAWFAFVIVVPALASNFTVATYPVPPRLSLITASRAVQDSVAAAAPRRADALSEYLAEHPQYRGAAKADTSDPQVIGIANANVIENKIKPVYDAFEQRLHSRQDAAERLRFFSPTLATQSALLTAAGTGTERGRQFEETWIRAHEAWRAFFNDRVFAGTLLTRAELATAPVPMMPAQSVSTLLSRILPNLAGTIIPALLLAAWGVRALRTARTPVA